MMLENKGYDHPTFILLIDSEILVMCAIKKGEFALLSVVHLSS